MKKVFGAVALAAFGALGWTPAAESRVTRFVVEERVPFAPGTEWGGAGAYERLKGTAFMEVDPADPGNAVIVNLDRAPRNARGKVEFSAPFLILKPVDMRRGNQKIWYGINNRSNCIELSFRTFPFRGRACNVSQVEDLGADHPLLQEGFSFVDAGWHADALPDPTGNRLVPKFPIATNRDGTPITGLMRVEHVPLGEASFSRPLVAENGSSSASPTRTWRPYEPASTSTAEATLTVRDSTDAPRETIAPDKWAFGTCATGAASLKATSTDLCVFDGFQPGRIYELTYTAKNPVVMGLAYAVTRDVGSFLRYQTQDDEGNPNPLALNGRETLIRRAYSSGTSSTGMYQREFLYLGFNEDEAGRRVFDAATILSGGAYRLFANVQFAHPTFYSRQDANKDYVSNAVFPFSFAVTTDPVTGRTDGILKRPASDPLVMQIDEELVFWHWKASLNVHDGRGNPIRIPEGVRLYFQTGFGHITGAGLAAPPKALDLCRDPAMGVGNDQAAVGPTPRALVRVIDDWADRGIAPPPSNYPRVETGELVTLDAYRSQFAAIRGRAVAAALNDLQVLDFGPGFDARGGVQTILPPRRGESYAVLVPRPGRDGVASSGINTLLTRAPLGTNVGWNPRTGKRTSDLCGLNGGFLPFAATAPEREAAGDPRQSLAERHNGRDGFLAAVQRAADDLVAERFLLPVDAEKFIRAARDSTILR